MNRKLYFLLIALYLIQGCTNTPAPTPHTTMPQLCFAQCEREVDKALKKRKPMVSDALAQANLHYVSGSYEQALLSYEQTLANSDRPREQINALIGLAKLRLLIESPVKDAEAGALVLEELARRIEQEKLQHEFFAQTELLESVLSLEEKLQRLTVINTLLDKDLAKKEEAIKRLKELTVGSD